MSNVTRLLLTCYEEIGCVHKDASHTFYWLGLGDRLTVVCVLSKNKFYFQLLLLLNLLDYSSTSTRCEPMFIFVVVYSIQTSY